MKNKKIIVLFIICISIILIVVGIIYPIKKDNTNDTKDIQLSDAEKDKINVGNYYLEREIKKEKNFNGYVFSDVKLSGSNELYIFFANVKNATGKKIEFIRFKIQFLDENKNVAYEWKGATNFDLKTNMGIVHSETIQNIALYSDYKIVDIEEYDDMSKARGSH